MTTIQIIFHDPETAKALAEIKALLTDLESKTMSVDKDVQDFAAEMKAFADRQDVAVTDLQGDVKSLQDQIAALQATTGLSDATKAALADLLTRASGVSDKLDALDALTPPVVPTGG